MLGLALDQLQKLPWDQKILLRNQLQSGLFVKQETIQVSWDGGVTFTPQTVWVASGLDIHQK